MAMPVLAAGHPPTGEEFKQITDAIDVHDLLSDAVNITHNPIITAAAFSSETDITRGLLTATVTAGCTYLFTGQLVYLTSNTDTEGTLRIRTTTPLTGDLVGTIRLGMPATAGYGRPVSWAIPWTAPTSGAETFHLSVQRNVGSGTITLEGGTGTWLVMCLIGRVGSVRTVSV